jgi:DNA-binding CsgD family transcriptional regulator
MDQHPISLLLEREKQILRLIAKGYDTKAIARELEITGNVVNERLREVRKKLSVTSSREAARFFALAEEDTHKKFVPKQFGIETPSALLHPHRQPGGRTGELRRDRLDLQMDVAVKPSAQPVFGSFLSLPLRITEEMGNDLTKSQRLVAIVEVAVKLVVAVAIVFFIAFMVNNIIIQSLN